MCRQTRQDKRQTDVTCTTDPSMKTGKHRAESEGWCKITYKNGWRKASRPIFIEMKAPWNDDDDDDDGGDRCKLQ